MPPARLVQALAAQPDIAEYTLDVDSLIAAALSGQKPLLEHLRFALREHRTCQFQRLQLVQTSLVKQN